MKLEGFEVKTIKLSDPKENDIGVTIMKPVMEYTEEILNVMKCCGNCTFIKEAWDLPRCGLHNCETSPNDLCPKWQFDGIIKRKLPQLLKGETK